MTQLRPLASCNCWHLSMGATAFILAHHPTEEHLRKGSDRFEFQSCKTLDELEDLLTNRARGFDSDARELLDLDPDPQPNDLDPNLVDLIRFRLTKGGPPYTSTLSGFALLERRACLYTGSYLSAAWLANRLGREATHHANDLRTLLERLNRVTNRESKKP